jgi:hypothetical protein
MNMRREKNRRLKRIAKVNLVIWAISVMMVDSKSYIPLIICGVTSLWLLLFAIANVRG